MSMLWIVIASIALLLWMIVKKVHPMLALLATTIVCGIALQMPLPKVIEAVQQGIGSTMGSVAFVIVMGAIMGKWMEATGAAHSIAKTLVKSMGVRQVQWAMLLTSLLVGIPMFYNAGFVVLVPLVFALAAQTGMPLLYVGLPMAAALSVTHGLLPPHPSPVALATIFKAQTGKTMLYGLIICIPAAIIAGPLLGRRFKHVFTAPPAAYAPVKTDNTLTPVSPAIAFFMAMLPVALILLSLMAAAFVPAHLKPIANFVADPLISFSMSVCIMLFVLIWKYNYAVKQLMEFAAQATAAIAVIIMIIAAGGAFKQVLVDSGVGEQVKILAQEMKLSPLLFGWLVAAMIRVTLGSATVAGLTAAGIVAPLVAAGGISPELMVLAVGSGSLMFSHVNDTGFWMFKEYFNLSIKQTFMSWTLMETIVSVLGLIGVLIIQQFI